MTQPKKTGLGRGLSALLNDAEDVQRSEIGSGISPGNINNIRIEHIETNPYQPRSEFEPDALKELSDSIRLQGLIQPVTVRKLAGTGTRYQLISGERRLRASKLAGLTEIPAYVRTANDQQMLEMALTENIQREDLNALEVALSFQRMIDECNLKQEELGDRVSKNRSTVTNYLRLLKLPPTIQASIRDNKISMGHARALLGVEDIDKQLFVHREILTKGLSVRKVEELVRAIQNGTIRKSVLKKNGAISFQYQKIQDDLASKFATRVVLKVQGEGKGAIEIPFISEDDLNRILELLDW
jgi:ParB family chromosome partitioning protein